MTLSYFFNDKFFSLFEDHVVKIRKFDIGQSHICLVISCLQIFLLRESLGIDWLLFPQKSSENHRFSDDFWGNGIYFICSNSLKIRSEIWGSFTSSKYCRKIPLTETSISLFPAQNKCFFPLAPPTINF